MSLLFYREKISQRYGECLTLFHDLKKKKCRIFLFESFTNSLKDEQRTPRALNLCTYLLLQ